MGWFHHQPDPPYLVDLADFSGAVDRLQDGDLLFLSSACENLKGPRQDAARAEARQFVHSSGRRDAAEDLDLGLVRWAGAMNRPTGYTSLLGAAAIHLEPDLRRGALQALHDAGWAILLRDLLSSTARDTLMAPWDSLAESPERDGRFGGEDESRPELEALVHDHERGSGSPSPRKRLRRRSGRRQSEGRV